MSRLLMDDPPLVVQPALAVAVGLNEAIVLQQIHYWLQHNQKTKRHLIDDVTWCYNSIPEWVEQFPFWSESTIWRTLKKLKQLGLLKDTTNSSDKRDRTLWYTIDYKALDELFSVGVKDASSQVDEMQDSNLTRCISSNRADVYKEQRLATETTTETKDKGLEKKEKFDPEKVELPTFVDPAIWLEWCQHRIEIKNPLTSMSVKKQLAMLAKTPNQANTIISHAIEKGWKSFWPLDKPDASSKLSGRGVKNSASIADDLREQRRRALEHDWENDGQ